MSEKISADMLEQVRRWAEQGVDLNGIQKNLASDCGVHMTYMELRFLLLDHGIEIASVAETPKSPTPATAEAAEESATEVDDGAELPVGGRVQVSLDEIQLPGALISGKATFPGGASGAWLIDQMGRFGWRELLGSPSPQEMQEFQMELTQMLSRA